MYLLNLIRYGKIAMALSLHIFMTDSLVTSIILLIIIPVYILITGYIIPNEVWFEARMYQETHVVPLCAITRKMPKFRSSSRKNELFSNMGILFLEINKCWQVLVIYSLIMWLSISYIDIVNEYGAVANLVSY